MKKNVLCLLFVLAAILSRQGIVFAEENKEQARRSPLEDLLNWPIETAAETGETIFNLGAIRVADSRLLTDKTEANATDLPESVTALNEKAIESSPSSSLPELLSSAEGVTYTDDMGQGLGARVDLRGFGGEAKQALALFDGVRAVEPFDNSMTWHLYPSDYLKQVEIRRGGNSTVYGEGALSGVLLLETKDPTLEPHVATENQFGSFREDKNFVEGSGTVSGIGVYAAGRYYTTEGYRQNSDQENTSTLLKVTGSPSEFVGLKNTFYYANDDTGIPGPLTEAEVQQNRRQKDPDGQFGDKFEDQLLQDSLLMTYTAEPLGIEFSDLFGYRLKQQDSVQSFGGSFPGISKNKIGTETYSNVLQGAGTLHAQNVENEISSGFEWSIDDIHNPFTFIDLTFGPFSSDRSIDRRFLGYFAQDRLTLWEHLIVEAGIRYDDINWQIYDLFSPSLEKKKAADHWSPKLALEYKFSDALSVFGGISESFKVPDSNTLIFETPNIFSPNPNIDPSVARHRELGVRYAHPVFGSLRATYFNIESKKEILFNDITNTNENFDTRRQGVELGGEWSWGGGLQTFARYSYTEAEFDNGRFDGKDIPLVPRNKWAAGFVWDPDQHWELGMQAQGTADQFALNDFNNRFRAEDYWTLDARVAYKYKNAELFFKAQNITGETYSSFVTSDGVSLVNFNPAPEESFEIGFRIEI